MQCCIKEKIEGEIKERSRSIIKSLIKLRKCRSSIRTRKKGCRSKRCKKKTNQSTIPNAVLDYLYTIISFYEVILSISFKNQINKADKHSYCRRF
jgi:hypothetical protein